MFSILFFLSIVLLVYFVEKSVVGLEGLFGMTMVLGSESCALYGIKKDQNLAVGGWCEV